MKSVSLFLFCLVVLNGVGWSDSLDICFDNTSCSTGYYCQKTPGDCSGEGVCTKKPTLCIDLWEPVCGCDGKTYSNACDAAMEGVNVNYDGPCASCVNPPALTMTAKLISATWQFWPPNG